MSTTTQSATTARIESIMSGESDTGPYACRRRYLLCSSPRTGSSIVAAALRNTGCAGLPHEYLNPHYIEAFARRMSTNGSRSEYLSFLESRRCSSNGVFGLKLHFQQFTAGFRKPEHQFQYLQRFDKCVVISRRNAVAQALSLLKAMSIKVWNTESADTLAQVRSVPFSPSTVAVARTLALMIAQNAAWPQKLREAGVDFITVYYEDLAADFPTEMGRLAQHLAIPELLTASFAAPPSLKLSDQTTDLLQERFLRDITGATQSEEPTEAIPAPSLLETTHE
jgi:trehalose 2-sulfotransferase